MNFLELVQRTKAESPLAGGGPASIGAAVGDTLRIVRWVADAWNEIQTMERNWKWMSGDMLGDVTVVGGRTYTIDQLLGVSPGVTRLAHWKAEDDDYQVTAYLASNPASEWPLRFLPYGLFRQRFEIGQHAAGAPQFWTEDLNGSMKIGPTPDQSYKLRARYWKSPQALSADADIPEMPVRFHMAIVWKALLDYSGFDAASEVMVRAAGHWEEIESKLIFDQGERITISARPLA